jgi:VanZ family protein
MNYLLGNVLLCCVASDGLILVGCEVWVAGMCSDAALFLRSTSRNGLSHWNIGGQSREDMQVLIRVVSVVYLVFLTLLLLTTDPSQVIGFGRGLPLLLRSLMPVAHLLSFSLLAVLALSACWPVPRWGTVLILSLYGGMTEIVQSFVQPRTPEWADWFQDVAGVAVGATFCWGVGLLAGAWAGRWRANHTPAVQSDDWETLQRLVSPPTADE